MRSLLDKNGEIRYTEFTISEFLELVRSEELNMSAGIGFYSDGITQSNERAAASETDIARVCESKKYKFVNWYWVARCVN